MVSEFWKEQWIDWRRDKRQEERRENNSKSPCRRQKSELAEAWFGGPASWHHERDTSLGHICRERKRDSTKMCNLGSWVMVTPVRQRKEKQLWEKSKVQRIWFYTWISTG